ARRGPKYFGAEPREIVARHRGGNHLDRTTRQTELQRPDGILPTPIVQLFQRRREDALLLQFTFQSFVHGKNYSRGNEARSITGQTSSRLFTSAAPNSHRHVNTPFFHAQTRPSTSSRTKIIIAMKAPGPNPVKATAKGSRKMV